MQTVLPDTIIQTIHDTTVVRDTVFHYLGRAPIPLPVTVEDPFAWVPQVASALVGALIGGSITLLASRNAIRQEWKLDRQGDLHRLVRRVRSNLERVRRLAERLREREEYAAFTPDIGDELEVIWTTYYRVADPIFSLGDDDLSERIDAFFQRLRTTGVLIRALESGDAGGLASLPERREAQAMAIAKYGTEAGELQAAIDSATAARTVPRRHIPPPRGREEAPETCSTE